MVGVLRTECYCIARKETWYFVETLPSELNLYLALKSAKQCEARIVARQVAHQDARKETLYFKGKSPSELN